MSDDQDTMDEWAAALAEAEGTDDSPEVKVTELDELDDSKHELSGEEKRKLDTILDIPMFENLSLNPDGSGVFFSQPINFVNEFGGLEQPTKSVLGSMVMLNKNFGIGTKEASKLNKVFQNIGGLSEEQSQFLIGQTAEMAKMAGVAPQKVISD